MEMNPAPRPPLVDPLASEAASDYVRVCGEFTDRMFWPLKMFTALNLFLWHMDAFERDEDPVPLFVDVFTRATRFLRQATASGTGMASFPPPATAASGAEGFEQRIFGLFSDVWVGLTDDVYFDQSYEFTRQRLEKNEIAPGDLFGSKVVLDAGCGSGKFSCALARFGADRVIGVDLGQKGLSFARDQAARVSYGHRLDYLCGSLLDLPLPDASVDLVWSNGVVHHTLDYERCIGEFARVVKPAGTLFLYVNGRFGLFELLLDTLRTATADVPRELFQHFLILLGINSGRIYWIMDCLYAPYEWKGRAEVVAMLERNGFSEIRQLTRGVAIDQIEQVSAGLPHAEAKYGEAQLKFVATRT
ncbi:MAG: methyltransferase domain-containing protein [Desulfobacterales bacterium]|nr:methyltransferase domain-containing protein [Desulfobacterales bacterium]